MAARDEKGEQPAARRRRPSTIGLWFEEAWEGWLKSLGGIGLILIAYLLYKFDLVPETLAGAALVLIVIVGAIAMTALPAWSFVKTPVARGLFVTFLAVWAVGTGYPTMRSALPPRSLAEVKLTPTQLAAKAHVEHTGPLELTVSGHFKGAAMAEADANYTITVDSAGGHDEVSGTLKRALVRYRAGRRGGTSTSIQERTEELHRLHRREARRRADGRRALGRAQPDHLPGARRTGGVAGAVLRRAAGDRSEDQGEDVPDGRRGGLLRVRDPLSRRGDAVVAGAARGRLAGAGAAGRRARRLAARISRAPPVRPEGRRR